MVKFTQRPQKCKNTEPLTHGPYNKVRKKIEYSCTSLTPHGTPFYFFKSSCTNHPTAPRKMRETALQSPPPETRTEQRIEHNKHEHEDP
jgi:hypothetical protein